MSGRGGGGKNADGVYTDGDIIDMTGAAVEGVLWCVRCGGLEEDEDEDVFGVE